MTDLTFWAIAAFSLAVVMAAVLLRRLWRGGNVPKLPAVREG